MRVPHGDAWESRRHKSTSANMRASLHWEGWQLQTSRNDLLSFANEQDLLSQPGSENRSTSCFKGLCFLPMCLATVLPSFLRKRRYRLCWNKPRRRCAPQKDNSKLARERFSPSSIESNSPRGAAHERRR